MQLGRLGLGLGIAIAIVLGIAACEGSDDDDVEGSAGEAGHQAAGAPTTETGGAGGEGAMTSGGTQAGTAGSSSAGEGGGGGQGGDAGPAVSGEDCDGNPYTLDAERTRLCVLLASCAGPSFGPIPDNLGGDLSVSSCLRQGPAFTVFQFRTTPPDQPLRFDARASACSESITTCDDVLACAGYRLPVAECDDDAQTRCEGELAINCGAQPSVTDCERTTGQAGACQLLGEGAEQRAACVVKEACDEAAGSFACDGDTLYRCTAQGVGEGSDCSQFGLTCQTDATYSGCVEPAPSTPCDMPGKAECSGNAQTFCSADGLLYSHACGAFGELECIEGSGDLPSDGVWLDCLPSGCQTLLDEVEKCDGDDLLTDFGLRLHCPDYGFTTCEHSRCVN